MSFLERTFYNNTIQEWGIALLIAAAVIVIFQIARSIIVRRVNAFAVRTSTDIDNFIADLLSRTNPLFLLIVALYVGAQILTLTVETFRIINHIVTITFFLQIGLWGYGAIIFWVADYKQERLDEDAGSVTIVAALGFVGKLVLWTLVLLLILDNIGIDVTSLVASLGITGVAVALAVQNILGDLLASLSIVLDKPFVIGDFIIVGDYMGTVEKIGMQTTRLKSISGEQVVLSNGDLIQSRIRNYKHMQERRVVFSVGVLYDTPPEKIAAVPEMVRTIIESQEQTRFDRAHFYQFGDFSLNYEIVYFMLTPDYNTYMDVQQAINLELLQRFQAEGIEFAYPTQTLFVNQEQETENG